MTNGERKSKDATTRRKREGRDELTDAETGEKRDQKDRPSLNLRMRQWVETAARRETSVSRAGEKGL